VAEEVSRHVVTLPCHAAVTAKEAERTLEFPQTNEKTEGSFAWAALAVEIRLSGWLRMAWGVFASTAETGSDSLRFP